MKKKTSKIVERSRDLPASMGMLYEVRDEMRSGFRAVDFRMNGLEKRMDGLNSRMDGLDSRMDGLDSRMGAFDHKLDRHHAETQAKLHQMHLLLEEQNARNKYVLDKLVFHHYDLEDLKARVTRLEESK